MSLNSTYGDPDEIVQDRESKMKDQAEATMRMDGLLKRRVSMRKQLMKLIEEVGNSFDGNQDELRQRLVYLERYREKISNLDNEIMIMMSESSTSQEELDEELENVMIYERRYEDTAYRAGKILQNHDVSHDSNSTWKATDKTPICKLPMIELTNYDGSIGLWLSFWSIFEKIHSNQRLTKAEKFQYLAQAMIKGSDAQRFVSAYPQSENNYEGMITAFQKRFGDPVLLVEFYVKKLMNVIANRAANREISIKLLFDEVNSNLRTLQSLGVDVSNSALFLYPLIEAQLPDDVLISWQRTMKIDHGGDIIVVMNDRLDQLLKFLERERFKVPSV